MLKRTSINPFVVLGFLLLIIVPAKVPAILKFPSSMILGGICIFLQFIALLLLRGKRKESIQTALLIFVTVALTFVYYKIYSN